VITHISPVVLRQEVGRRIRLARQEAELTLSEAAERLDLTRSALSRLENGATMVTVHVVRSMMDVYDVRLDDILDMIRQAKAPGWWRKYGLSDRAFVALETGASRISNYELALVPGLLQTADYARALFRSSVNSLTEDGIANWLAVRLTRQERLTDDEHPISLDAVVHEMALRQPVGGSAVMRAQLQHLALINELPTVTLRLLPADLACTEAYYGGFSILDFPQPGQPSMSYANHGLGELRQDKAEHVEPARLRFDYLRSSALDPIESIALIERVTELWSS